MWRRRGKGTVALVVALLLAVAVACGDDDGGQTNTPAGTDATPPPGGDRCETPPPQSGEGPEGLQGTITYVRLIIGCEPDVYVMDANGDNSRPVVQHPAYDDEADLSPDGSRVVFLSARAGASHIYSVNIDGSDLRQLTTQDSATDVAPRWSPDGSQIAFSSAGNIVVMNADGSGRRVIMEALPQRTREPCRVAATVGDWSPDGQRITYYSTILSAEGNRFWLCAVNVENRAIEVLVSEPEGGLHAEPHWSPDGTKIAFRGDWETIAECNTQGLSGCNYEIYVLDLQSGEAVNITNSPGFDIEPVWSPDGEWILFASNRDDPNFDLYVMRPDGSEVQRILNDPASKDSYPSWR